MDKLKKLIVLVLTLQGSILLTAQPVAKRVIAEHFTNTYCSVCASRNPGFYANLWSHPEVLHIAYHPSAPYPSCPLSLHNVAENNARTNYYGIFGSTPRLAVQGIPLSSSANYGDPVIFTSVLGQTTPISMRATLEAWGADSVVTTVVIKKEDASSLSGVMLYAALVEDTLTFAASNGEPASYDVFRKAVWGTASISVTVPAAVGDSVTYTKKTALNSEWNPNRMNVVAILQDGLKSVIQAAKSANLAISAGVADAAAGNRLSVYPNPAGSFIQITGDMDYPSRVDIQCIDGRVVFSGSVHEPNSEIDISGIAKGVYLLTVSDKHKSAAVKFAKN